MKTRSIVFGVVSVSIVIASPFAFAFANATPFAPTHSDPACVASYQRVAADLADYDVMVASMKDSFQKTKADDHDRTWVKAKLQHMADVDQYMRSQANLPSVRKYSASEAKCFWEAYSVRFKSVDAANTADMEHLLSIYEWFKISEFGIYADTNAWLLVQHADERPDFQARVLPILYRMAQSGETMKSNYAYLFDRVAASWSNPAKRTLQRYGTQGSCAGKGNWQPIGIEEPQDLDLRRADYGMEPFADYKKRVDLYCN